VSPVFFSAFSQEKGVKVLMYLKVRGKIVVVSITTLIDPKE
jgi:hypothetical protein